MNISNYSFVSNNCLTVMLYREFLSRPYNTPFIGSYFQCDIQFVKFCKNYDYYIAQEPIFGEPILPFDTTGPITPGSYPTMFLGDIEISWIHETDIDTCRRKYKRRLRRCAEQHATPFFVLGDSLLHQYHSDRDSLIREFEAIPNSIYVHSCMSSEWKGCDQTDRPRTDGHANPVVWQKPRLVCEIILAWFDLFYYQ